MSEPKAPALVMTRMEARPARLYHWGISPFCYKVRMAAAYKGMRFDEQIADLRSMREAKARTGSQQVPVIETKDGWVTDSTSIAQWLEDQYPEPSLFPDDPAQRADCLLVEDWADQALNAAAEPWLWLGDGRLNHLNAICANEQTHRPSRLLMRALRPVQRRVWGMRAARHGGLEGTRKLACSQYDLLEMRLDADFLFGDTPTIADFAVAGQLANLLRFDAAEDLVARPKLHALVKRCIEWLPEKEVFQR